MCVGGVVTDSSVYPFFSKSCDATKHDYGQTIRVTQDSLIHCVDLIRTFCSIKQKEATVAISLLLPDELFPQSNFIKSTAGNSYTNLLNVENAISLFMVIPGRMAAGHAESSPRSYHAILRIRKSKPGPSALSKAALRLLPLLPKLG